MKYWRSGGWREILGHCLIVILSLNWLIVGKISVDLLDWWRGLFAMSEIW